MTPGVVRSRAFETVVLFLAGTLILAGCSHRTPYFREGVPETVRRGPGADVRWRLVLVGDAGEPGAVVLDEVENWAGRDPAATEVLFLGDNMYPEGMTPRRRGEADLRLLPQIEAATRPGAGVLFIPGNHDWADGESGGYEAVVEQARYVETRVPDGFMPSGGCPGPVALDGFDGLRIIVLDTQWWLRQEPPLATDCSASTPSEIVAAFGALLETDRHVVVAAHHPLFGYGRHSGFFEWREHVVFPVVGSLVALSRKLSPPRQDYGSDVYRAMTDAFRQAFLEHPSQGGLRIWASGHEHNLQVLEGVSVDYVLISGSGSKTTPVDDGSETLFAHSHPGFMVLELLETGEVWLSVVEPGSGIAFSLGLGG